MNSHILLRFPNAALPHQRFHSVKDSLWPSKLPSFTAVPAGCRKNREAAALRPPALLNHSTKGAQKEMALTLCSSSGWLKPLVQRARCVSARVGLMHPYYQSETCKTQEKGSTRGFQTWSSPCRKRYPPRHLKPLISQFPSFFSALKPLSCAVLPCTFRSALLPLTSA